ncbi:MAG: alpha/beta hydrolase fold domain-containing protein [Sarcina sp.]
MKKKIMNAIIERVLKVMSKNSPYKHIEKLEEKINLAKEQGEYNYRLPKNFKLKSEVEEFESFGMVSYKLRPKELRNGKKIIYLHGGAYVEDMNKQHWIFIDRMVKKLGCEVILPMYPLAPFSDCETTFEKLSLLYDDITKDYKQEDIILMGDSAGGGLALALAQDLKINNKKSPSNIILLSPWLDVSMQNEEMREIEPRDYILGFDCLKECGKLWANELSVQNRRVSPIYGNFEGLGKITVFTGTNDILWLDALELKGILEEQNIDFNYYEFEGMPHVFAILPIPESDEVIEIINLLSHLTKC